MIKVEWGDRGETILKWQFGKQWTVEQLYTAAEYSNGAIASKSYPVDVMAEMESILFVPSNLITMAQNGLKARPSNIGIIVIISTSNFWSCIFNKATGIRDMAGNMIRFARSVDEAYAIIGMNKARTAQRKTGAAS